MQTAVYVLIISIALSYGWGMRGALIGGEKGALLPGAMLGMFLALFSGVEAISSHYYVFAAAGAIGMSFGGFEPYAQTMGFILHKAPDDYKPKKGYAGLALKGALWFGIAGVILGMTFSAVSGYIYSVYELIVFAAVIPFVQALGVRIFNKPYDKSKGLFPKIYFSISSREEWGGNLLMLILSLAFVLIKGDYFAALFSLTGIISGAVGWIIAIYFYDKVNRPLKSGKYIFGKANKNGYIDGWKIMEFTLGAVNGLSFAAFFFLSKGSLLKAQIDLLGGGIKERSAGFDNWAAVITAALILLTALQYAVEYSRGKKGKETDVHIFELIERPLLLSLPLIFIWLGSQSTAKLYCVFVLLYVGLEQVIFERSKELSKKGRAALCAVCVLIGAASLAYCFFGFQKLLTVCMILYTVGYILMQYILDIIRLITKKEVDKGSVTVGVYFAIQSAILIYAAIN
ncbi:MAG: hypothetical protein ACI4XH_03065 [Acutalibacteraceae bacterium]